MKLLTAAQTKYMDGYAINTLGISSTGLMERAAAGVAYAASGYLSPGSRCAVFCGSGNNGGDGVAAASILLRRGCRVRCFLVGERGKMTADTAEMERRLSACGGILEELAALDDDIRGYCTECAVIIDAMFGTGLHSALRGTAAETAAFLNSIDVPVISADIPSGVETDTGAVRGEAVNAEVTVTFTCAKPGHYLGAGGIHSGRVVVCDIGIPLELYDEQKSGLFAADAAFTDSVIPHRPRTAHKGDFGKLLMLCGSAGYTGAPVLAARAAVRSGAGLVYLGVRPEVYPIVAGKLSSSVVFPAENFREISERLEKCDAVLIGCGLGTDTAAENLLLSVLKSSKVPVVVDADGITLLARNINVLGEAECPVILTPHDGEFARLTGSAPQADRVGAARDFAAAHGCTVVLKGYRTITAFADGSAYINTTGNPGMAVGGSGDVLAGVICSMLGQLHDVEKAVPAAVYIHGAAGDLAASEIGEYGLTPDDIVEKLPLVLKKY